MDPAASTTAAPAADSGPKKQPKARKLAKDMMPHKRMIQSKKRAGWREAVKNQALAACLDEERQQETERYLAVQALANSEELAGKPVVCAVMLMKHEALNFAFGVLVLCLLPTSSRSIDKLGHVDTDRARSP
jgi:hypothetical protein